MKQFIFGVAVSLYLAWPALALRVGEDDDTTRSLRSHRDDGRGNALEGVLKTLGSPGQDSTVEGNGETAEMDEATVGDYLAADNLTNASGGNASTLVPEGKNNPGWTELAADCSVGATRVALVSTDGFAEHQGVDIAGEKNKILRVDAQALELENPLSQDHKKGNIVLHYSSGNLVPSVDNNTATLSKDSEAGASIQTAGEANSFDIPSVPVPSVPTSVPVPPVPTSMPLPSLPDLPDPSEITTWLASVVKYAKENPRHVAIASVLLVVLAILYCKGVNRFWNLR